MGADDTLPFARGDGSQGGTALDSLHAAQQQPAANAQRCKRFLRAVKVLAGQNLGGRHQRGLIACLRAAIDGGEGDRRLAAAYVALHHAAHSGIARHIGAKLFKNALLRLRGRKGQAAPVSSAIISLDGMRAARRAAQDGQRSLIKQQFFKGDAPLSHGQTLLAVWCV